MSKGYIGLLLCFSFTAYSIKAGEQDSRCEVDEHRAETKNQPVIERVVRRRYKPEPTPLPDPVGPQRFPTIADSGRQKRTRSHKTPTKGTHGLERDVKIIESNSKGIEFVYTPGKITFDRAPRIQNTHSEPDPGKPALPIRQIAIGVPIGSTVEVNVIESVTTESTGVYVPPTFGFAKNGLAEATWSGEISYFSGIESPQEEDETIYSRGTFWPSAIASIEEQETYRSQEVLKLRINPLQYNPRRNALRIHKQLRIRVDFRGGGGVARTDRIFDPVFESSLINYDQARNWRQRAVHKSPAHPPAPWYKVEIGESGIYKIGREQLYDAGIVSVDPRTLKLYNGGSKMVTDSLDTLRELSIRVLPDTSIFFYGTALSGWGKNGQAFLNPYTDTNVYWLTHGGGHGRRDSIPGTLTPNLDTAEWYVDTIHIEYDSLCPAKSGLGWVWEKLIREEHNASLETNYLFDVHRVHGDSCDIGLAVHGWVSTFSGDQSRNIWHNVRLHLNGQPFFDTTWKNRGDEDLRPTVLWATCTGLQDGTNTFTFEMYRDSLSKDVIFFDWFEVTYKRKYEAYDGNLAFEGVADSQKIEISGFDELPVIFEITDAVDPKLVYGSVYEDSLAKLRGGKSLYFASTNPKISTLTEASPYDLRTPGTADFVIITHPEFLSYANTLRNHRESQGLRTEVFSVEDVYENFSWGLRHSPYAMKNFLSFAYDNWGTAYCLLLGAGTYAYRNEALSKNRIPPFESGYKVGEYGYPPADNRCEDHWYTDRNLAIGRITATTGEEARDAIVEKIIKYEQNPGVWQNRVLLIADDEDPDGATFVNYAEGLAQAVGVNPGYDVFKLYATNYSRMGGEKPHARLDLIRDWSKGRFLTLFGGHGNLHQLCHENILRNPQDIDALHNGVKLPFSHFWSCGVSCFDRQYGNAMGDYLQKVKGKGSIGTLASTRATSHHGGIAQRMVQHLLIQPQQTIGLAVYGIGLDIPLPSNTNLFADPTTQLPDRSLEVIVDSFADTLRGGEPLEIWGTAEGADIAYITVRSSKYDTIVAGCRYKMRGRMIDEQLCEDILFEGIAKVENGRWYHKFFIPVEINPLLCGNHGKISIFAWADTACGNTSVEATVTQGELNPEDTVGPSIELFADDDPLLDGVNIVPQEFTLCGVLEDQSGINVFNSIRPYDLALFLRVNSGDFIPLADSFQYDTGSCHRGRFNYVLQMDPVHEEDTLYVQASDNMGNRTVVSVIVLAEVGIEDINSSVKVFKLSQNCPNPFVGSTIIKYQLPTRSKVSLKVYDVTGRMVKTLVNKEKKPGRYSVKLDTRELGSGIYFAKLVASPANPERTDEYKATRKLILTR